VKEIVTYVEMTAPSQLVAADPVPGLTLEPIDRGSPLIPDILARIGAPHNWKSTSRTEGEWAAWFAARPDRRFRLLSLDGQPAGMVTYDLHPGADAGADAGAEAGGAAGADAGAEAGGAAGREAEIVTFGLLPEFVGKGLGGFALTLGVRHAWALAPSVSRVWLHTSSLDHPHALPNYHRRGFRTFKTEQGERD
jgi:GNAT superfamily N-acetyltransferase